MTGTLKDLTVNRDGTQNVTVTVTSDFTAAFDSLKGKEVSVEIKRAAKGRSRDANAFCWALCSEIGRAMTPPMDKADIYRRAIKAVGVHTNVAVPCWQIETLFNRWEDHGTGWFAEVVDDFSVGSKWVCLYYGSSTYTVDEMRILLDWLVDECRQMELPIPLSKKDEEELLERWGHHVTGNGHH